MASAFVHKRCASRETPCFTAVVSLAVRSTSTSQKSGDLDCRGARFDSRMATTFTVEGARIAGTFYWGPFGEHQPESYDDDRWWHDLSTGSVDFRRARASRFDDHWTRVGGLRFSETS